MPDTGVMMEREDMWRAVEQRDRTMDGRFVYAVKSTRVYCRPGCPSRRPDRQRVEFFDTPEAAARAGYRACKRCRPDQTDDFAARVSGWIEQHEAASLENLAAEFGMSASHLQRRFKQSTGMTPKEYAAARRAGALKQQLKNGAGVTAAIYEAGFGSGSRVYEGASRLLGMTPAAYAKGAAGERIRYGITETALGPVMLACTDRGVCAVRFEASEPELRSEFPGASIERDQEGLRRELDVVQALATGHPATKLPLDLQGTAFQLKIWQHLRTIPRGRTETYAEVARAVGQPNAVRAVANACAANPAALAVPCHRVVRSDGEAGGYRWGTERKQALLASEGRRKVASV
ncbi:MAG: bifunctional transcriptional activator/DNA repair enzyme AdaA [Bryobacteraceae bacterium]